MIRQTQDVTPPELANPIQSTGVRDSTKSLRKSMDIPQALNYANNKIK
jgi:hypothetical protein